MAHFSALHAHTPALTVIDSRGLTVRSVNFHRARMDEVVDERIARSAHDAAGRLIAQWDPRLWAAAHQAADAPSNLKTIHSLTGQLLLRDSVDDGWRVQLQLEAGETEHRWDGRGNRQRVEYDPLLRMRAVFEGNAAVETCVERLSYGGPEAAWANQCGQLIRHDDPAGSLFGTAFDLNGNLIQQQRRFLTDVCGVDWPESAEARDALLEPETGAQTSWRFAPTQEVVEQCDAKGNIQSFGATVAGQPRHVRVQLAGQDARTVVSDIRYDAQNRIISQTAGNDVVTTAAYAARDDRLLKRVSTRSNGEKLQNLHYACDPLGNVISIKDDALATGHFNNQRIDPVSTFTYDTLYQLIEATGTELASLYRGPDLPAFQSPIDSSRLTRYRQTYQYDTGGNLLRLSHVGTQNHSRSLVAARTSNRCLAQLNDTPPTDAQIDAAFDANGNLLQLQPGQTLQWNARNQLHSVTPVARLSGQDDSEAYRYDSEGARVRKIRMTQSKTVEHREEVRYLPGLELRTNSATGESLHVMTVQAGLSEVRVLHWESGKPDGVENDQHRFTVTDHLSSSAMELDEQGQRISQESYYPFGGTAWWAGRSLIEAHYKTVRYSGKERDATGLYYYGLRYYAPWLMRWLNPDPTLEHGGINLFRFCNNSPMRYSDREGAAPYDVLGLAESTMIAKWTIHARGLDEFGARSPKMREALHYATSLVGRSIAKLSAPVWEAPTQLAVNSVFGAVGEQANRPLVNSLVQQFKSVDRELRGLGNAERWRLNLGSTPSSLNAVTVGNSEERVENLIYFNHHYFDHTDTVDVAATLIHEVTHAAADVGSFDFFYLWVEPLHQPASDQALDRYIGQLVGSSRAMAENGPDELQMEPQNIGAYRYFLSPIISEYAEPDSRRQAFVGSPEAMAVIASHNADSLMAVAMISNFPLGRT